SAITRPKIINQPKKSGVIQRSDGLVDHRLTMVPSDNAGGGGPRARCQVHSQRAHVSLLMPLDHRRPGLSRPLELALMARLGHRTPVHAAQPVRLREPGYDEQWLQDWLAADPSRLGLGQVVVLAQELTHATGGSLDILAADGDTYYSIEVQLGEVDASHGFRVLDYWARNRARYPDKTHVAALLVESADGRFRQALQAIAEYLPLIVVALRAWRGATEGVPAPELLIANESLDVGGTVGLASGKVRTEEDWREQLTEEAWAFFEAFVAWTREHLGEVRVDYSPKSYIGLRRGRRVWAPLWFRRDGATVYLPDPDGSRAEEPSVAVGGFRERRPGG